MALAPAWQSPMPCPLPTPLSETRSPSFVKEKSLLGTALHPMRRATARRVVSSEARNDPAWCAGIYDVQRIGWRRQYSQSTGKYGYAAAGSRSSAGVRVCPLQLRVYMGANGFALYTRTKPRVASTAAASRPVAGGAARRNLQ